MSKGFFAGAGVAGAIAFVLWRIIGPGILTSVLGGVDVHIVPATATPSIVVAGVEGPAPNPQMLPIVKVTLDLQRALRVHSGGSFVLGRGWNGWNITINNGSSSKLTEVTIDFPEAGNGDAVVSTNYPSNLQMPVTVSSSENSRLQLDVSKTSSDGKDGDLIVTYAEMKISIPIRFTQQ